MFSAEHDLPTLTLTVPWLQLLLSTNTSVKLLRHGIVSISKRTLRILRSIRSRMLISAVTDHNSGNACLALDYNHTNIMSSPAFTFWPTNMIELSRYLSIPKSVC